jgi:tetratricopeptide (TPR) repeat protein
MNRRKGHDKTTGLSYAKSFGDDAIRCFDRAVSLDAQDAEAHFNLGVLLSGKKEMDRALTQLGEAVNLNPAEPKYSLALAEALIDGKRYSVAVEFLNAVRSKFDGVGQFHYTLGLAYYGLHDAPSAIEEMQKAVALEPVGSGLYFLGNTYALAEQYEKAQRLWTRIELNPACPYHSRMALVADKLGQSRRGARNLQQVVLLTPTM